MMLMGVHQVREARDLKHISKEFMEVLGTSISDGKPKIYLFKTMLIVQEHLARSLGFQMISPCEICGTSFCTKIPQNYSLKVTSPKNIKKYGLFYLHKSQFYLHITLVKVNRASTSDVFSLCWHCSKEFQDASQLSTYPISKCYA